MHRLFLLACLTISGNRFCGKNIERFFAWNKCSFPRLNLAAFVVRALYNIKYSFHVICYQRFVLISRCSLVGLSQWALLSAIINLFSFATWTKSWFAVLGKISLSFIWSFQSEDKIMCRWNSHKTVMLSYRITPEESDMFLMFQTCLYA